MDELTIWTEADCDDSGCNVCGVEHDEEIHAATLRLHRWFRVQVTQYLFDWEDVELEPVSQVA